MLASAKAILQLIRIDRMWKALPVARRDVLLISSLTIASWLWIVHNDYCTIIFHWLEKHPEYELDAVVLVLVQSAFGIAAFAFRRMRELQIAVVERDDAERRAREQATRDPLTGLPNRRALSRRLKLLGRHAGEAPLGMIVLDLDRFKSVNDVHGHLAGDRLLLQVAARIKDAVGIEIEVFRLGGDEFGVAVENPAGHFETYDIAERIITALRRPFADSGLIHHIGASAGVAHFPDDVANAHGLIRAADQALYSAKQAGRGVVRYYNKGMDEELVARATLEAELRSGILRGEFQPYYQPVIDFATGQTTGYEMLARWQRADGIEVGPERFIPVAEEYGLIGDIFFQLLDRVCEETRHWDPELTIAVNISPVQLKDPALAEKIIAALFRKGFPPQRLGIEITENALVDDEESAMRIVYSLRNQGMRIGLDDFGTGYSSLHHLRLLPFDRIKIDKSFIVNIDADPEAEKIVRAIHGLASSLDLSIIAEGIESETIAEIVHKIGCDQGQGYFYGRPAPARQCLAAPELPLKRQAGVRWR